MSGDCILLHESRDSALLNAPLPPLQWDIIIEPLMENDNDVTNCESYLPIPFLCQLA